MAPRLPLKDKQGDTHYEPPDEVLRLEARKQYTAFILNDGITEWIQCGCLSSWWERLKSTGLFCQVHKSHVVRVSEIEGKDKFGNLIMKKGPKVPLSDTYKDELAKILSLL